MLYENILSQPFLNFNSSPLVICDVYYKVFKYNSFIVAVKGEESTFACIKKTVTCNEATVIWRLNQPIAPAVFVPAFARTLPVQSDLVANVPIIINQILPRYAAQTTINVRIDVVVDEFLRPCIGRENQYVFRAGNGTVLIIQNNPPAFSWRANLGYLDNLRVNKQIVVNMHRSPPWLGMGFLELMVIYPIKRYLSKPLHNIRN